MAEPMSDERLATCRDLPQIIRRHTWNAAAFGAAADAICDLTAEVERLRALEAQETPWRSLVEADLRTENAALRAQLAKAGEVREAQADLEPAGVQYRSCGPNGWIDDLPEDNEPEWIAQFPNGWSEGYWPEQRQLYGGAWQRIVGDGPDVEQEAKRG